MRVLEVQIERESKPPPEPPLTILRQEPIEIGVIEVREGDYSLK